MITFHHAEYSDAFEQEGGLVGWEQRYAQLAPGRYCGEIDALSMAGITIYRERIGLPVLQEVVAPKDQVVFGATLNPSADWRYNADPMAGGKMVVTGGGREALACGTGPSDLLLICVERGLIETQLGRRVGHDVATVPACQQVADTTQWMVSLLAAGARGSTGALEEAVLSGLMLDRLAGLAGAAIGIESAVPQPAFSVYRRIRDFVDDQAGEPLSVRQIADAVGIAPCDLRLAFSQAVGISPGEWIRKRRLNGVRRELAEGDRRTVSEIAMNWGFWHLGRFSQYYAAQFGEAPSETAQRCRMA